jgi:hypothetical protein
LGSLNPEHPDVKKNLGLKKKLDAQIAEQVAANLQAMATGLRAFKGVAENAQHLLDDARTSDIKNAEETRPYWEAKAELDRMKRMREVVQLRDLQAQKTPDASASLDLYKQRIAQYEAEIARYHAQYPGIALSGGLEDSSSSSIQTLSVERDGTMKFGSSKEAISLDELKTALMREHEKDSNMVLRISADTNVPAQRIYDILDAAKKAGISSISLQTLSNLK